MADILDAATTQQTKPADPTVPAPSEPTPPPSTSSPVETPSEPTPSSPASSSHEDISATPPSPEATALVDSLINTPTKKEESPKEPAPSEPPPTPPGPPLPKKGKKLPMGVVAAVVLLLLAIIPVSAYFISQHQNVAELPSRAAGGGSCTGSWICRDSSGKDFSYPCSPGNNNESECNRRTSCNAGYTLVQGCSWQAAGGGGGQAPTPTSPPSGGGGTGGGGDNSNICESGGITASACHGVKVGDPCTGFAGQCQKTGTNNGFAICGCKAYAPAPTNTPIIYDNCTTQGAPCTSGSGKSGTCEKTPKSGALYCKPSGVSAACNDPTDCAANLTCVQGTCVGGCGGQDNIPCSNGCNPGLTPGTNGRCQSGGNNQCVGLGVQCKFFSNTFGGPPISELPCCTGSCQYGDFGQWTCKAGTGGGTGNACASPNSCVKDGACPAGRQVSAACPNNPSGAIQECCAPQGTTVTPTRPPGGGGITPGTTPPTGGSGSCGNENQACCPNNLNNGTICNNNLYCNTDSYTCQKTPPTNLCKGPQGSQGNPGTKCQVFRCGSQCNNGNQCNLGGEIVDCSSASLNGQCGQIDFLDTNNSYCGVKAQNCSGTCAGGGGGGGGGGDHPTPTPTPRQTIAQCLRLKVYKDNVVVDPATLKAGDSVVLTVRGEHATKGRIRVNGGAWTVSETKNSAGEYTVPFTIPTGVTNFVIEGEVNREGTWR